MLHAWLRHAAMAALAASLAAPGAAAAELYGVALPDRREVGGVPLLLNGIGARILSPFGIKIYVAGLYLERPATDAAKILASPQRKLIEMRFLRAVDRGDIARAWRIALADICRGECRQPAMAIAQFEEALRDMADGGEMRFSFAGDRVEIFMDGQHTGTIVDPAFAPLLLATWIGERPPTEELKAGLLGIGRQ